MDTRISDIGTADLYRYDLSLSQIDAPTTIFDAGTPNATPRNALSHLDETRMGCAQVAWKLVQRVILFSAL
jgi:hypothetical protein